jgi:hypothetical protein
MTRTTVTGCAWCAGLIVLACCAGPPPPPTLSPALATRWTRGEFAKDPDACTWIVVTTAAPITPAQRAELDALGASLDAGSAAVVPDRDGLDVTYTDAPSNAFAAEIPYHALGRLAALPWVRRLDLVRAGTGHFHVGMSLTIALMECGSHRPTTLGASVEIAGCLDDERRRQLAAAGATIGAVIPALGCKDTIFTMTFPASRLREVLALEWLPALGS